MTLMSGIVKKGTENEASTMCSCIIPRHRSVYVRCVHVSGTWKQTSWAKGVGWILWEERWAKGKIRSAKKAMDSGFLMMCSTSTDCDCYQMLNLVALWSHLFGFMLNLYDFKWSFDVWVWFCVIVQAVSFLFSLGAVVKSCDSNFRCWNTWMTWSNTGREDMAMTSTVAPAVFYSRISSSTWTKQWKRAKGKSRGFSALGVSFLWSILSWISCEKKFCILLPNMATLGELELGEFQQWEYDFYWSSITLKSGLGLLFFFPFIDVFVLS